MLFAKSSACDTKKEDLKEKLRIICMCKNRQGSICSKFKILNNESQENYEDKRNQKLPITTDKYSSFDEETTA